MNRDGGNEQEEGFTLSNEHEEEIRQVLAKYQRTKYSVITLVNAAEAMNDLGMLYTEAEIAQMFEECNLEDHEGVTVDQFLQVMTKVYQHLTDTETLKAAFKVFDTENNGFFRTSELRSFALTMGVKFTDEEFEDMINEIDLDHDGKINWQEFLVALKP